MGLITSGYGATGYYGEFAYKGEVSDSPAGIPGIARNEYRKCFHYGFSENQGFGWDEVTGDSWPYPESQGSIGEQYDDSGQLLLLCLDENDGLTYILNSKDGPVGSGLEEVFKDKYDYNDTSSGTDIEPSIKLPEHTGSKFHYQVEHAESHMHLRPIDEDNINASGFDSDGLPTSLEIDGNFYKDGKTSSFDSIDDIKIDREILIQTNVEAGSIQQEYTANKSEFKISRIESYYKVSDQAKVPYEGNTTEADYQTELDAPIVWISRNTLLTNRYNGQALTGAITTTSGPDGQGNSAYAITTTVELSNAIIASGTLLLWHKSGYTISGVALTEVGSSGTWILSYSIGALPASIELGVGDVFDVRLFSSELSSGAITSYYNNVVNDSGRAYLP